MSAPRWFWLLGCLAVSCVVPNGAGSHGGADEDEKAPRSLGGLEFLPLDLPDGGTWTLGSRGMGRPFLARLRLSNRSDKPIRLWDPENSEGSRCAFVELTDGHGRRTLLRPPAVERSGTATVVTVPPHGVLKLDLELLRLIGERPLPPGKYALRATYENRLDHVFGMRDIWTGRIAAEAREITVVATPPG